MGEVTVIVDRVRMPTSPLPRRQSSLNDLRSARTQGVEPQPGTDVHECNSRRIPSFA